jgi:hypothetical protein
MSTQIQDRPALLDPGDCWNLIERVAATPSLKRAARLREFLLYVGNQSLKLGRTDIHEQEIGETVFGRPRAYDTGQDNIVRVSATELRKRIDAYFAAEGLSEPVIFEIPRGTYLPAFRQRETAPIHNLPSPLPVTAPRLSSAPRRPVMLLAMTAIALLLAVLCMILLRQNAALHQRIQILEQHSSVEPSA